MSKGSKRLVEREMGDVGNVCPVGTSWVSEFGELVYPKHEPAFRLPAFVVYPGQDIGDMPEGGSLNVCKHCGAVYWEGDK